MKILLVDDELEFISTLAERLHYRGIEVAYTSNPAEAVELVKASCFQVAVLDMKMPGISGLEVKALLEEHCPQMKFIFLTGHGSEEDYVAGRSASAFYLLKPINIEALLAKIKEAAAASEEKP
ncbi:MAG: response regulator [Desulfobulbaceae bacterium]|jgi:DNA-binding response OmpR family regulator|nr:response regulator [Desulfobulbaceae bacterium]